MMQGHTQQIILDIENTLTEELVHLERQPRLSPDDEDRILDLYGRYRNDPWAKARGLDVRLKHLFQQGVLLRLGAVNLMK